MKPNRYLWLLWALLIVGVAQAHAAPKKKTIKNDECLACHSDASMTKDDNGKQVSLHVDDGKFNGIVRFWT